MVNVCVQYWTQSKIALGLAETPLGGATERGVVQVSPSSVWLSRAVSGPPRGYIETISQVRKRNN